MRIKRWAPLAVLATAAVALTVVAGVYAGSATKGAAFKVGLVTDIGGLNDRGFNQLAFQGVKQGKAKLGANFRVLTSTGPNDYIPNLTTLARGKYDLVIAVGFLMTDAVDKVATSFKSTKFAIVDVDATSMKHKPKNVLGLLFKEQETGCLVGTAAALVAKAKGGKQVISSVGGIKIPPVDRFIAGYQFCAKRVNPGIKTLNGYSQDFVDQAKCKEVALNQIAQGSQVVFQVAGGCGLGALDAAKEKGKWGIGVDANQGFLGKHMLTSALKKVDVAVLSAIQAAKGGTFIGGKNATFTVQNGGVDYGLPLRTTAAIKARVDATKAAISNGTYPTIPDTVK